MPVYCSGLLIYLYIAGYNLIYFFYFGNFVMRMAATGYNRTLANDDSRPITDARRRPEALLLL